MDISSLLDVVMSTDPGSVIHAHVKRGDEDTEVEFEIKTINGQEIEEA